MTFHISCICFHDVVHHSGIMWPYSSMADFLPVDPEFEQSHHCGIRPSHSGSLRKTLGDSGRSISRRFTLATPSLLPPLVIYPYNRRKAEIVRFYTVRPPRGCSLRASRYIPRSVRICFVFFVVV